MTISSIEFNFFVLPDENSTVIPFVPYSKPKWCCSRLHSTPTKKKTKKIKPSAKHDGQINHGPSYTNDHDSDYSKLVVFYTSDLGENSTMIEMKIRERIDLFNETLRQEGVTSKKAYVKLVLVWRLLPNEYEDWIGEKNKDASRGKFYQKMDSKRKLVNADLMMLVHNWHLEKPSVINVRSALYDSEKGVNGNQLKMFHHDKSEQLHGFLQNDYLSNAKEKDTESTSKLPLEPKRKVSPDLLRAWALRNVLASTPVRKLRLR